MSLLPFANHTSYISKIHPLFYDALICRLPHLLMFSIVESMPECECIVGPERHLVGGFPMLGENDSQNAETSLAPSIFIFKNGRPQY